MTRRFRLAGLTHLAGALAGALALALTLAACSQGEEEWQGWIEADMVFVSPDEGGRLTALNVAQGDQVKAGDVLFTLDDDLQRADLGQARATLDNAEQAFARARQLIKTGAGTQREFDATQSAFRVAKAQAASAETRLARRIVRAPAGGTVQEVYFRAGEMASAQKPVVALLPPGNIKARFYVRETELAGLKLGDKVSLTCDGCAAAIGAQVIFKSQTVEYTPPVIYSLEERGKLVFLIQARPDRSDGLNVGQPIQVQRAAAP